MASICRRGELRFYAQETTVLNQTKRITVQTSFMFKGMDCETSFMFKGVDCETSFMFKGMNRKTITTRLVEGAEEWNQTCK